MRLTQFKEFLSASDGLQFRTEDGTSIPDHFHVTEVGTVDKNFIDCGGTVRREKSVSFQLWSSNDTDHRLRAEKLRKIIDLSERIIGLGDHEIEVEYQSDTIGKFGLDFDGNKFVLTTKSTACLASDSCGIPSEKAKVSLADLAQPANSCGPGSGCCG